MPKAELLQQHGHRVENVAAYGRDEGKHHDRQDQAGGQNPNTIGRPGKQGREHGHVAEGADKRGLNVRLQEGSEDEQAPDAVDNAGNACQQLDGDADRAAQYWRAEFSQKDRSPEPYGNRDEHRDEGCDQSANDRRAGAEILGNGVPSFGDEEAEAEGLKGERRAHDERRKDRTEDDQHPYRRRLL